MEASMKALAKEGEEAGKGKGPAAMKGAMGGVGAGAASPAARGGAMGGAGTGRGEAAASGLNNSMEMGEVEDLEEDADIINLQMRQAAELTKQEQVQQQMVHQQQEELTRLLATHAGIVEHMPMGQRMPVDQQHKLERQGTDQAHQVLQGQLWQQQQVQRQQHEEVLQGLRQSKINGDSSKEGGHAAQ
jgi:hypothetical protein